MNDVTTIAQGPACQKRRRRLGAAIGVGLLLAA